MERFEPVDMRVLAAGGPVGLVIRMLGAAIGAAVEAWRRPPAA